MFLSPEISNVPDAEDAEMGNCCNFTGVFGQSQHAGDGHTVALWVRGLKTHSVLSLGAHTQTID